MAYHRGQKNQGVSVIRFVHEEYDSPSPYSHIHPGIDSAGSCDSLRVIIILEAYMNRFSRTLFILLLATALSHCATSTEPSRLRASYLKLIKENQFAAAFEIINQVRDTYGNETSEELLPHFYFYRGLDAREKGNYQEALEFLESALSFAPQNQEILHALGDTYLQHRKYHDAIQVFQMLSPLADEEREKQIPLKIARAWASMGEYLIAINELKSALLKWPQESMFLSQLSEYLMKNRAYQEAADTLLRLSTFESLSVVQKETLRQARESARMESNYDENYSANFHVWIQDEKVGRYRHEVMRYLEEIYSSVGDRFSFYPRQITRVSLLNQGDFQGLVKLPDKVIGVSNGISHEIQIPLARIHNFKDPRQLKNTLFHEYAHHLVRLMTKDHPSVPIWFHEGIATYLEPYRGSRHEEKILRSLVSEKNLASESDFQSSLYHHENSSHLYVQAASLISYLDEKGTLETLLKKLSTMRNSRGFEILFKESTGTSTHQFFTQWTDWISQKMGDTLAKGR